MKEGSQASHNINLIISAVLGESNHIAINDLKLQASDDEKNDEEVIKKLKNTLIVSPVCSYPLPLQNGDGTCANPFALLSCGPQLAMVVTVLVYGK